MNDTLLAGIALIVFLGITSQWIAWRFRLPSILVLLFTGILAGPITGILDIDLILGDLLFPIVSISVAIILFEGGLSLRISDLREVGGVVRNLIVIGVPVTWVLSGVIAHFTVGLTYEMALLLGAVLVVTGPTVIIPLLKQIRPVGRVSSMLRWEGIVIDPVGAVLALLMFEEILAVGAGASIYAVVLNLVRTLIIGGVGGWFGARAMIELYSRYLVPYTLQNAVTLLFVIGTFSASNLLQPESGLVTVTVMGFLMANQKRVDLRHIVEFKENLQVLLISSLFIMLAARLDLNSIFELGWGALWFLLAIILIRPVAVFLSSVRSGLNWREKVFLSWMAPRGIVAAAVSSIFALELEHEGFTGAENLVSLTFMVIISTVTLYSLTAGRLARILGLAQRDPQGVLFIGAHPWVRRMATALQSLGFRVLLADSNQTNVEEAESEGLETYYGNILSESAMDDLEFTGIGRMLAVTSNNEVNSLASMHFKDVFGMTEVYQLPDSSYHEHVALARNLVGRNLFGKNVTYDFLVERFNRGAEVKKIDLEDAETLNSHLKNGALPLFMVDQEKLYIWADGDTPRPRPGSVLIALVGGAPPIGDGDEEAYQQRFEDLPAV